MSSDEIVPTGLSSPPTASLVFKVRPNGDVKDEEVLRLDYFALQGLGEEIRLFLEEVGAAYDSAYHFSGTETVQKVKGTSPTGQLPIFIDPSMGKDVVISQSSSILRHLARKYDMAGTDAKDMLRIDMISETAKDLRGKKNMLWTDSLKPKLMEFLKHFEKMLGEDELFGGKRVSIADIAAFHSLQMYEDVKPGSLLELGAEKLDAYRKRFAARPRIAAYLASPRRFPISINELGDPERPWKLDGYVFVKPLEWSRMTAEVSARE